MPRLSSPLLALALLMSAQSIATVSANDLLPRQTSGTIAQFCADPNLSGACVSINSNQANVCVDITPTLNPSVNGVTSFQPTSANVQCKMYTGASCTGHVWSSSFAILAFQLLSFNGTAPDNAIVSVNCS